MENLRNHKIFVLEEVRREALFTAAMAEFANNGYKKASTDAIVDRAGISKGLLFHYFGTKRDFYVFLFEYANRVIMTEYYDKINMETTDILSRLKSMILLKLELTDKYPTVFEFISSAYYEKDPGVSGLVSKDVAELYTDASRNLLENIDCSLFKPNINIQRAIDIILFTLRGYSEAQTSPERTMADYKKEHQRYVREVDEYLVVLRQAFYKGEQE